MSGIIINGTLYAVSPAVGGLIDNLHIDNEKLEAKNARLRAEVARLERKLAEAASLMSAHGWEWDGDLEVDQ
jgi:hypothetical protein